MASVNWTDNKLIEIWGEEDIQEQLETTKRSKHVYDRMAEQLHAHGIDKNGEQVRSKVKKLWQEYKKIRDGHKETGNEWKKWKYYDKLNEIMGNRPSVAPPVVLDTLDSSAPTSSTEKITSDEEESREITDNEKEETDSGDEVKSKYTSNAVEKTECVTIKGKKRKCVIMEEVVTKAMKTVTEGIKKSEKMFIELEEKQMLFEERMRQKNCEFHMEMMKIFVAIYHHQRYSMYQPLPQAGHFNPSDYFEPYQSYMIHDCHMILYMIVLRK